MTAKEWLMRGWRVDREIGALMSAKEDTFERLTAAVAAGDGVVVSSTPDPHKFDRYVELEDAIDHRVDALCEIKREIITVVSAVPDARMRTLLMLRYVDFRTFEQIAVEMHYSWRHIMGLHKMALGAVKECIEFHIGSALT